MGENECETWADPEGNRGSGPYLENHKLLFVSLEILARTSPKEQLDPSGPIASRGRSVRPYVNYVDDFKNQDLGP